MQRLLVLWTKSGLFINRSLIFRTRLSLTRTSRW
jgi:hypothetical protein